jgi:hypothetical protein
MAAILNRFGHLLAFLAVALVALLAHRLGAPAEITAPLGVALGARVLQIARQAQPSKGTP